MDGFSFILIFGIIAWTVYSMFALFVHRKERLNIVEKLDFSKLPDGGVDFSMNIGSGKKFWGLRIGLLLVGIGLGLLLGFLIITSTAAEETIKMGWSEEAVALLVISACILLLGGAGLLAAYLIERNNEKKK